MNNFNKLIEISYGLWPHKSTGKNFHTTFLLKRNRIVSIGWNNYFKTHPRNLRYGYIDKFGANTREVVGIHSETSAVLKYGEEDCSDMIFVNIRIKKDGLLGLSFPCHGCRQLLYQVGFKKFFYTTTKGEIIEAPL